VRQQQKLQKIFMIKHLITTWTSPIPQYQYIFLIRLSFLKMTFRWDNSNRQDYLQAILCTCIFRLLDTAMVSELLLECKHFRFFKKCNIEAKEVEHQSSNKSENVSTHLETWFNDKCSSIFIEQDRSPSFPRWKFKSSTKVNQRFHRKYCEKNGQN